MRGYRTGKCQNKVENEENLGDGVENDGDG